MDEVALDEIRKVLPNMVRVEAEIRESSDVDLAYAYLDGMTATSVEEDDDSTEYLTGRLLFALIRKEIERRVQEGG